MIGDGEPLKLDGAKVSAGHFQVLGAEAAHGRLFREDDGRPGAEPVVVLSHGLWQSRYGDPSILGQKIDVDDQTATVRHTVIGILPPDYRPIYRSYQLWLPLIVDPAADDYHRSFYLEAIGRLAPGATREAANAEVRRFAGRQKQRYPGAIPDTAVATASVEDLHDWLLGSTRPLALTLLGAVGFVLLIACTNVASLLLVRADARRREMAIRAALGAGRSRMIGQLLVESALLALAGGAAGLAVAVPALDLLSAALPSSLPQAAEIVIDLRVLGFALAATLASAFVFGLIPAFAASRADLRSDLHQGSAGSAGRRRHGLHRGIIAAEVAVSVVLLVGAGLMLKSLWRLERVDPGFRAERTVVLRLSPPASRYSDDARQVELYESVRERLLAVPGIDEVGAIHLLPMSTGNWRFPYVTRERPVSDGAAPPRANFRVVTPGYFEAMGIPLVEGRLLTREDRGDGESVGLVNRTLARQLWDDGRAVGKTIELFNAGGPSFTVVGVVGDVRQHELAGEPSPEIYRPHTQWTLASMFVAVRTSRDPRSALPLVRDTVWSLDADLPISDLAPMREVVRSSNADSRFTAFLVTALAALALGLGALGLYGVISFAVARRTTEIGIRMALGARRSDIVGEVVGGGMRLTAIGLAVGVAAALGLTRWISSQLYEVSATDAGTFVAAAVVLAAVALASTYLPARRASAVDPIRALRHE